MIHIAILLKPYLDLILSGEKTIESRLTLTNRAPYRAIEPGERLYLKQSAGPFRGTALAEHVLFAEDLTPARVARLKRDYNHGILGAAEHWQRKRNANYATLIWVHQVEPIHFGPRLRPQRGIAWLTLPEAADVYPQCRLDAEALTATSVELTPGNLRHHHVCVRRILDRFPADSRGGRTKTEAGKPIQLRFRDGTTVQTDIVGHNGIIRARGPWRAWFESERAQAGDRVVFLPRGRRRFAVDLVAAQQLRWS